MQTPAQPCAGRMEPDEGAVDTAGAADHAGAAGPESRVLGSYVALHEKFITTGKQESANGQYANLYFSRLAALRPVVLARMQALWGWAEDSKSGLQMCKLLDVPDNEERVVLGTIFADMKNKPNILEEYTRDPLAPPAPVPSAYFGGGKDKVLIEDESGRLELVGDVLQNYRFVTGIVVAVRGRLRADAGFEVTDVCLPEIPPQPSPDRPLSLLDADLDPRPDDQYMAFVSGLSAGSQTHMDHLLPLQLFLDYLSGHVGGGADTALQRQIVHLVLCGGLVSPPDPRPSDEAAKYMQRSTHQDLAHALEQLECMLLPVVATTPVEVMCAVLSSGRLQATTLTGSPSPAPGAGRVRRTGPTATCPSSPCTAACSPSALATTTSTPSPIRTPLSSTASASWGRPGRLPTTCASTTHPTLR